MENKDLMKTYIIRIYRHNIADSRFIVGTVEKVGVHGKMAFSNRDELWEIMNSGSKKPGKQDKQKNRLPAIKSVIQEIATKQKGGKNENKTHKKNKFVQHVYADSAPGRSRVPGR